MTILDNQQVIAIEEHYYDINLVKHFCGRDGMLGEFVKAKILQGNSERLQKSNTNSWRFVYVQAQ